MSKGAPPSVGQGIRAQGSPAVQLLHREYVQSSLSVYTVCRVYPECVRVVPPRVHLACRMGVRTVCSPPPRTQQ